MVRSSKQPIIHPNWSRSPEGVTDGYSLEITAKDTASLHKAAPRMPPHTPIAITFLPGEGLEGRIAATKAVRALGFEPMPHFSARRLGSSAEFTEYLERVVREAGVKRCFVIAGDRSTSAGPFHDSSDLLESGAFERAGVQAIGVGGHPEGHPIMDSNACWEALKKKVRIIEDRGMAPLIVTQFGFDPRLLLEWLEQLRLQGINCPARIGIPGPASISALVRFAARCGVTASSAVMSKYGVSLSKLIGRVGPDILVDALAEGLEPKHGPTRLHFYPFGGLESTVDWIDNYAKANPRT